MRVVIELKRGEVPEIVLNNLYAQTPLETVFGINMVGAGRRPAAPPRRSRSMLEAFLRHRREVVTRRTVFELRKARERGHVLEGLAVALANIDEVIARHQGLAHAGRGEGRADGAQPGRAARCRRCWQRAGRDQRAPRRARPPSSASAPSGYRLSEVQAQAILDMRLHRLTGLEQDKIIAEYGELLARIRDLSDILARPERLLEVIRDELIDDPRPSSATRGAPRSTSTTRT